MRGFTLQNRVLGYHSSEENIGNVLLDRLTEWNIFDKQYAIDTDKVTNNIVAANHAYIFVYFIEKWQLFGQNTKIFM